MDTKIDINKIIEEYPELSINTLNELCSTSFHARKKVISSLDTDKYEELVQYIYANDPEPAVRMMLIDKMKDRTSCQEFLTEIILSRDEHLLKRKAWGSLNAIGLSLLVSLAPSQEMREHAAELLGKMHNNQIKAKDLNIDEKLKFVMDAVTDETELI